MAKPPFPWIGSKEKIAPYILQLFPPKLTQYVEPFGGSGAVLLALPPDPNRLDIYNDLDAELVNLFSCIKECSNVLLRELKFLPIHGRKLFEYYRDFVAHKEVYFQNVQAEIECLGDRSCFTEEQAGELLPIFQERLALYDVKRAAAYYLAIRGSFSGTINSFGVKGLDVERFLKLFPPVSARLKDVPLENKNALQLIRERDKKGSLNNSAVLLCFNGGSIPGKTPAEYVAYIEDMRRSFTLLDDAIAAVNSMTENSDSLDGIRVKAVFYAIFFGEDTPSRRAHRQFVDCFVTYEERTRTVTDEDGTETEESYTVAIPITDMAEVYSNIENVLHLQISEEQKSNADSVYNLARYGVVGGSDGWIPGVDVPYIGADGFCSPIGSGWESRVTSEFGNRIDPITGKRKGHTGMDLAVPTGTPIRAALPGTVTVSKYNAGGYGYYVCIDHGNGLATLYGHCSKLLAKVGQTVEAGDIIALSGSTGRSTGPHLHFEVRVNGERTNPRAYLPKS